MKISLCLLVFAALSCAAQETPAIQGHHMGETVLEYLKVENAGETLTRCHDFLLDPATEKLAQKDIAVKMRIESCLNLAHVIETGAGTLGAADVKRITPGHAAFDQGKLVLMELDFWNLPTLKPLYSFDSTLHDFSLKFGAPAQTWSDDFQNGYGARLSFRRAAWGTKDTLVLLSEMQMDSSTAVIEDKAFAHKSAQAAETGHKNALDR
jgi:hypothetical protein